MSSVPTSDAVHRGPDRGGAHEETRAPDGAPLPGWRHVLARVDAMPATRRRSRQHEIERLLRANGLVYGPDAQPDDVRGRPWRLDLVPMVIESGDWATLERGLRQRARLKQALLADIYGEQRLLAEGIVPPAMVYAHRGYLRDARGLPGSDRLPLAGVDVARAPSGHWYAADDVCNYPAGVGYALENRVVLSRVLPQLFRDCRVRRIVGYFRALQQRVLDAMDRDARCVLLGDDATHPHYFEFAWLAKYLGYTLVELGDLTVREDRVFLRTVAGLQRVDVILRFVGDAHADPLLRGNRSGRGVPGLAHAVRAGEVEIINPLGSGVLDNPALETRLPALCRRLFGEELALPGVPTWWLGDEGALDTVRDRLDGLLVRDLAGEARGRVPGRLSGDERATLEHELALVPERFVVQAPPERSLAPGYDGDERVSRRLRVRVYLVGDGRDFVPMSGGLCSLETPTEDAGGARNDALGTPAGGSKDVWVLADGPVPPDTLLRSRDAELDYAMVEGELPSRVAENLFWLGRNAERAEMTVRVLRAACRALQSDDAPLDAAPTMSPVAADAVVAPDAARRDRESDATALEALLRTVTAVSGSWPGFVGKGGARRRASPDRELLSLIGDPARQGSIGESLARLRRGALALRDRISPELMRTLNEMDDRAGRLVALADAPRLGEDPDALIATVDALDELQLVLAAFAGLAHENLTHGDGWRFLMLGRRVERARLTAVILARMLERDHTDERRLELLLQLLDSTMTYRSRYRTLLDARLALELLALDESNPRALAYQFAEIERLVQHLPGRRPAAVPDALTRAATAGLSRVRLTDVRALVEEGPDARRSRRQSLGKFLEILQSLPNELSSLLTGHYFTHVEIRRQVGVPGSDEPIESVA